MSEFNKSLANLASNETAPAAPVNGTELAARPVASGINSRMRHVFAFNNYSGIDKMVTLKDINIWNIDFSDHAVESNNETAAENSTAPPPYLLVGSGSFIRSKNSNLMLDTIKAINLSSSVNASFIHISNVASQENKVNIDIKNSLFENCSAMHGGVIFYSSNATLNVNNTIFKNNFAIDGAVI